MHNQFLDDNGDIVESTIDYIDSVLDVAKGSIFDAPGRALLIRLKDLKRKSLSSVKDGLSGACRYYVDGTTARWLDLENGRHS